MATPVLQNVGRNVQFELKGDKLVITVDLSAPRVPSATGKTMVIASTQGNQPVANQVDPHLKVGVNVYTK